MLSLLYFTMNIKNKKQRTAGPMYNLFIWIMLPNITTHKIPLPIIAEKESPISLSRMLKSLVKRFVSCPVGVVSKYDKGLKSSPDTISSWIFEFDFSIANYNTKIFKTKQMKAAI